MHYNCSPYLDYKSTNIAVYVNNLNIVDPDHVFINCLENKLATGFMMNDLGHAAHYLGIKFDRTNDYITINQTIFIDQLFAPYLMTNCNTDITLIVEELCPISSSNNFELD